MWKRAVWMEGRKEEEGTVPSTWINEGCRVLYWPPKVNAQKALTNRADPDPKTWRRFELVKIKLNSGKK